jgi:SAM-dependent methyltransferase
VSIDGPNVDQRPESWSAGADGYAANFEAYTARYVDEMLDLLDVGPGRRLLDVAAGTGVVSVRAAERGAQVTSTDFAPGMVEVAARRLREGGHDDAVALVMDGQALDLPDDAFDAAVSMFGLMFFPDTGAGLSELRRVVHSGGRIGIGTWDLDGFPIHRLIGEALARALPDRPPSPPPPPTWAPLGTVDGLGHRLATAELDGVEVRPVVRHWTFADPERFFRDIPSWSSPVRPLFDMLPPDRIDAAAAAFADIVSAEGGSTGDVGIPMTALFGTATVPTA